MQDQLPLLREKRGKILIDELTGKRKIAGTQIKNRGGRRREQ